jgi:hypothetical protein
MAREEEKTVLIYMAKPCYGGWVSFTAHLSKKYNFDLYKLGKRTEKRLRDFGYNVNYQNIHIENLLGLHHNLLITAIDKNYYQYLDFLPDNTKIVIHDPTEIKGKSCQKVIDNLPRFKVFTIRKTVQEYLLRTFNISSTFLEHPFFEYSKSTINYEQKNNITAISRIDFDKHTELILYANKLLKDKKIDIYGAKNDLYVYHHIQKKLQLEEIFKNSYKGTFKKSFVDLDNILSTTKIVVDLSAIKNDGGGSQYTFLEAIYQDCILVLNSKWVENINSPFVHKVNCLLIKDEQELVELIETIVSCSKDIDLNLISTNAKKLLEPHIKVDWNLF